MLSSQFMLLFSLALVVSAVGPPPQVLGGRAWVGGATPGSKCMRGQGGHFISQWGQLYLQMACVELAKFLEKTGVPMSPSQQVQRRCGVNVSTCLAHSLLLNMGIKWCGLEISKVFPSLSSGCFGDIDHTSCRVRHASLYTAPGCTEVSE